MTGHYKAILSSSTTFALLFAALILLAACQTSEKKSALASCASGASPSNAERLEISCFSISTPGRDWMAYGPTSEKSDIGETTSVYFRKEVSKTHTFILQAAVTVFDQPLEAEFGRWKLLSAVADYKKAQLSTGRHRAISFKLSSWDWSLGADCLRYDAVSEDHGGRSAPPGSFLTLTEHGYICVHPELDASAVLIYSERLAPGEQLLPAFEEEGEIFLRGLEFIPGAASDSPKRQFTQGLRYFFGHGIAQDRDEAVKFLCQAARKGSADAAILLNAMQSEFTDDDKLRASILSSSPAVALAALRDTFKLFGTDITRFPAVCKSKAD